MGLFSLMVSDRVHLCELHSAECAFHDSLLEDCIACDCVGVAACSVTLESKIDRKVTEKLIM